MLSKCQKATEIREKETNAAGLSLSAYYLALDTSHHMLGSIS
jgi:hypothetical protein